MPRKIHNILQNFSAGVLSPRYSARVDAEAYSSALTTGKNTIISSQGGVVFREGMEYVGVTINNSPSRLFQFLRGGEISDLMLEVSTGATRFWLDGAPYQDLKTILSDEADDQLLIDEADGEFLAVGTVVTINPYTTEELDTVYFTNQDKYGILAQGNHPPLYITIRKDGSVISELITDYRIPEYNYKDVNSPSLALGDAYWTLNFPASWKDYNFQYYMLYDGVVASYDISYPFDGTTPENNRLNIENNLNNCAIVAGLDATFTVTLAAGGGLSYNIAVNGTDSGRKVECRPIGSSAFIPIQVSPLVQTDNQDTNNDGASESAWSYPTYVWASDVWYYKCILTHLSAAGNSPT